MLGFLGGTGPEGMGLALRLGLAGEPVFIGSRDAARATAAGESLRAQGVTTDVQGGLNEEAAERADTVVVAVPFEAQRAVLVPLRERLRGKIVLDTAVALTRTGGVFELLHVEEGSAALQAQALLPGSNMVAAFQTISARDLLDAPHPVEGDVVVCADDAAAKRLVMGLAERIPALRAVDGGGLAGSRYVEGLTPLLLNVNRLYKARTAIRIVGI
ncbi:MAG: NADPH-dependent F420 reductase [Chloroflexota bacterium]|nr:NADPH-dependent F420 reductase [Chloroflexota bacterium]MDE2942190.1 NADPH-dependent F420 reductase [Chloroflexota bacterium]MDE3267509.1 NADPH-dependent F420 reductase [Chloroflexota bacterium]